MVTFVLSIRTSAHTYVTAYTGIGIYLRIVNYRYILSIETKDLNKKLVSLAVDDC